MILLVCAKVKPVEVKSGIVVTGGEKGWETSLFVKAQVSVR